jgi:hypothetical protein
MALSFGQNPTFAPMLTLLMLLSLSVAPDTASHPAARMFHDIGQNNISSGVFMRHGLGLGWQHKKLSLNTAVLLESVGGKDNAFAASAIDLGYKPAIAIKGFPVKAGVLLIHDNGMRNVKAMNYALFAEHHRKHWRFSGGLHFRHYYLSAKAIEQFQITENRAFAETWNPIYKLGYAFFYHDKPWQIVLNTTNIDFFYINQITNPMFNIIGSWIVKKDWQVMAALWYRSAGNLNASVNPYEFFFRAGITWKINWQ